MRRIAASIAFLSCFAVGLAVIVGCDGGGGGGGVPPASYSVQETAASATITVTRTGGSGGVATVDYATSDGTAVDGSDYTAASATLTWNDGVAGPKTFTVTIINDATVEGGETVDLTLSNVTGASLGAPSTGVLTILDEDAPGTLQFSGPNYSVDEAAGPATITVTRTGGATGAVAVDYDTISGGSATEGTDYTAASGTLNWPNGDSGTKIFIGAFRAFRGHSPISWGLRGASASGFGGHNTLFAPKPRTPRRASPHASPPPVLRAPWTVFRGHSPIIP
jgi:hypothetical protein